MRRSWLAGVFGAIALMVVPSSAAAQGWGLGIFAKWSGPSFGGQFLRVPIGCFHQNLPHVTPETAAAAPGPNPSLGPKWLPFPDFGTTFGLPWEGVRGFDQNGNRVLQPASYCVEFNGGAFSEEDYQDPVKGRLAVHVNNYEFVLTTIPRIKYAEFGKYFEYGGGLGYSMFSAGDREFERIYVPLQLTIKPLAFLLDESFVKYPRARAILSTVKFPFAVNVFFDDVTNEDLGLTNQFQHGHMVFIPKVMIDFSHFFYQR